MTKCSNIKRITAEAFDIVAWLTFTWTFFLWLLVRCWLPCPLISTFKKEIRHTYQQIKSCVITCMERGCTLNTGSQQNSIIKLAVLCFRPTIRIKTAAASKSPQNSHCICIRVSRQTERLLPQFSYLNRFSLLKPGWAAASRAAELNSRFSYWNERYVVVLTTPDLIYNILTLRQVVGRVIHKQYILKQTEKH